MGTESEEGPILKKDLNSDEPLAVDHYTFYTSHPTVILVSRGDSTMAMYSCVFVLTLKSYLDLQTYLETKETLAVSAMRMRIGLCRRGCGYAKPWQQTGPGI